MFDKMTKECGFPAITANLLQPFVANCRILEIAESRDQIFDPIRMELVSAEIRFVGSYLRAWALPRYVSLDAEIQDVFQRFGSLLLQMMTQGFAKALKAKKLILANEIFSKSRGTSAIQATLAHRRLDDVVQLVTPNAD